MVDRFTVGPVLAVNGTLLAMVAIYFLAVHRKVASL
jgi:hypothetical protein